MLLRSLSDLSPHDGRRESAVIWGSARRADFGPYVHPLSIRAAWGGSQQCVVDGRSIALDDDNYLIVNDGRVCSTSIRAPQPVESLTISFSRELAGSVQGETSIEEALDRGGLAGGPDTEFNENLQPHDSIVSPVLGFIRAHLRRGLTDQNWYEEQLMFLLERMRLGQTKLLQRIDSLALIRPATRREAYRRIALATDYLHSSYTQEIDLGSLARTAFLSKYHFLRLFTLIHGITPRNYLQRKRVGVAVRLLESTSLPVSEVAARSGFAFESTLLRQVRRRTRLSPRQLRARVATIPTGSHGTFASVAR